ncbi:MAG: DNA internalization-related competence protein ComEC/Rec2 [Candidatus Sumerlaeota bacterium]
MKRPFYFLALSLLGGSVAGRLVELPAWWVFGLSVILALTACGLWMRAKNRPYDQKHHRLVLVFALASIFCIGLFQQLQVIYRTEKAREQVACLSEQGVQRFRGIVAAEPRKHRNNRKVSIVLKDVKWLKADGEKPDSSRLLNCRVQLNLYNQAVRDMEIPYQGQALEFLTTLGPPSEKRHPLLFDYEAYLEARGVCAVASAWRSEALWRAESADHPLESAFFSRLMQWRRHTMALFRDGLPQDSAAITVAMVLGETSLLDARLRKSFIYAGAAHFFAVSGLHTAMVAGIIFLFCRLLLIPARASAWVLVFALLLYCALVGFRAPVLRGAIMALFFAAPLLSGRRVESINALCVALFFTLLVNPLAIFRSDFQLSYICAFGLVTLFPALKEVLSFKEQVKSYRLKRLLYAWNSWLGQPLAIFLAAQLALLPLLAQYFGVVSIIGFIGNLLLVPLASFVLALAWAVSLLQPLIPLMEFAIMPVIEIATRLALWITDRLAAVPGAVSWFPRMPWWLILLYYIIIFSGPHLWMKSAPGQREIRKARLLLRVLAVVMLLVWWPLLAGLNLPGTNPRDKLQITMLDVGQGDSFVIQMPGGALAVVDTGRNYAASTITSYLNAIGVDKIDALILTHPDADHIASADELIENFAVVEIISSPAKSQSRTYKDLERAIAEFHIPVTHVHRGDIIGSFSKHDGAVLEILNPEINADDADANEMSIVFILRYGEMDFLFTGDAGHEAEREILAFLPDDREDVEVLKVGHHGSAGSSSEAFIAATKPEIALFSVGERNAYGHPDPEVLERLQEAGALILNTSRHGSVDIQTDGRRLWIRTTRPLSP